MHHPSRHGSWRRLARALPLLAMFALLTALSGCGSDKSVGPSGKPANFGILVVNGSALNVTVRVTGPQFSQTSVTVPSGGFDSVEVNASTGDAITFKADGGGLPTANGGCAAGADAVSNYPAVYAQVNILDPLTVGGPLQVVCSSGWQ